MNPKGVFAVGGLFIAGLIAFFLGEDDASAEPGGSGGNSGGGGGPAISPEDKLGAAEAGKLQDLLAQAVTQCPGLATGDPSKCNAEALIAIADILRTNAWKHPAVAEQAALEAEKLEQIAAELNSQELSLAQTWVNQALQSCKSPETCNVNALYAAANKLRQYPWKLGATKVYAKQAAANLESIAKDVEDYMAAKKAEGQYG